MRRVLLILGIGAMVVVVALMLWMFAPRFRSVQASDCGTMAIVGRNSGLRLRYGVVCVATGDVLVPFRYDRVGLRGDVAVVQRNPFGFGIREGAIDVRTRAQIIPARFGLVMVGDYTAVVSERRRDGGLGYTGLVCIESGNELIPLRYCLLMHPVDGMAVLRRGDAWGIMDIEYGDMVVPFGRFDWIGAIGNGMAIVNRDEVRLSHTRPPEVVGRHQSIIHIESGGEVIPFGQFEQIFRLEMGSGRVLVRYGGVAGIIDVKSGNEIVPLGRYCRFDTITMRHGTIVVQVDGEYGRHRGLVDLENGRELIAPGPFERIRYMGDNIAIVETDDYVGVIDIESGDEVVPFGRFHWIGDVQEGLVIVRDFDERTGVVDMGNMEEIISLGQYENITFFADGFVAVQRGNGTWTFLRIQNMQLQLPLQ